jgi:predicted amidohydrolase
MVVGDRKPEGRDEYLRYWNAAISVPHSDAIARMETVSRDTGVFLVVGVIEKDVGTLYCTVVFIDPAQGYLAKHRKLMPTGMERIIWGQGDGTTLPVPEVSFASTDNGGRAVTAKLSATICW